MNYCLFAKLRWTLIVPLMLVTVNLNALTSRAQTAIYKPIPITSGKSITDKLTDKDLPDRAGWVCARLRIAA